MRATSFLTTLPLTMLLTATAGCGNNGNGYVDLRANLGLNLADVAGFVVTQSATSASTSQAASHAETNSPVGSSAASELYALNKDGSLTIVTVTEGADGGTSASSSSTVVPLAVFDTKTYVLIAYNGVEHGTEQCNFVAARKADGALFCVTASNSGFAQVQTRGTQYGTLLQSDATGNIVWINHDNGVALLDLTDPNNPTQSTPAGSDSTTPSSTPGGPFALAVDDVGDALIADINGPPQYTRIFFPAGGFYDVSSTDDSCLVSGASANPSDFYYTTDGPATLAKLTATSATAFTKSTLLTNGNPFFCSAGTAKVGTHVFLTGGASAPQPNAIVDIEGDTATIRTFDALASVTQVGACDASLFALGTDTSGNGGVVRYDVAGSTFTTLVTPGAYALTAMSVSPGCELTFYGQRASDGAYILGTLPAGSNAVTVNATGFPTVTQIDRIN